MLITAWPWCTLTCYLNYLKQMMGRRQVLFAPSHTECVCIYIVYIFHYHPPKHLFLFSLSIIMTKDGKTLPICQEPNLTCSCLVRVLPAFGEGQCTCDSIPPYSVAILNCDNQSVIRIAHNDVFHEHKKHIEIIVI